MAGTGKGPGENCEAGSTEEVTFELDLFEWVEEDMPCRGRVPTRHKVPAYLGMKGRPLQLGVENLQSGAWRSEWGYTPSLRAALRDTAVLWVLVCVGFLFFGFFLANKMDCGWREDGWNSEVLAWGTND